MPGFKALKDRTTVLLGCSVAGCKLKPFVIWHSESPRVFRHINKHTLSVYYRSNKKLLLQDALLNCFAVKWRSTVWRMTYLSRFCLLLVVLLDMLLSLVIFTLISKWCFSPKHLFGQTNGSRSYSSL